MQGNVTVLRPKDPTAAERSRRYRRRRKGVTRPQTVTQENVTASVTVDTVTICTLAASVGAGRATAVELELAERLLLALATMLPEDGAIGLRTEP